jgi:hypothetical protein
MDIQVKNNFGKKAKNVQPTTQLTNQEINEKILETRTNHGFISIKGYRNQKGDVCNYLVQPLGDGGYIRIVKESLEQIDAIENNKFTEDIFKQAVEEMKVSFNKTLNDEHNITNNYTKETKGFYSHEENDAIYVKDIVIVKREELVKGERKKVNSREKTLAKKYLKNKLPIGKYQGTFKLDKDKFEQITFNKTSIINL